MNAFNSCGDSSSRALSYFTCPESWEIVPVLDILTFLKISSSILVFGLIRINFTKPSFSPFLNSWKPSTSPFLKPKRANSIARRIDDFPQPMSPLKKLIPSSNSIVDSK